MGIEIRKVPAWWNHPRNEHGYIPLINRDSLETADSPDENTMPDFGTEATCFQIYETISEGTPVSQVFYYIDEMREWLISLGNRKRDVDLFIAQGFSATYTIFRGQIRKIHV